MPNYRGLRIPKFSFGNLDSDALFGPLDQEVFDFYERNKHRYWKALDIGANIGVHSILMARNNWDLRAFEPDPVHAQEWRANFLANHGIIDPVRHAFYQAAVSDRAGTSTFVRVINNSTGSHLEGGKRSYGPVERLEVETMNCRPQFEWANFAKIDCEGHEATILECVTNTNCEFMVEVGGFENARRIYKHVRELGMGMWAQHLGWGEVKAPADVPTHHTQGHLFIGNNKP